LKSWTYSSPPWRSIAKEVDETPELVKTAPTLRAFPRLDEVQAARKPILRWRPTD